MPLLKVFRDINVYALFLQELHNMSRNDPGAKAIVFSQFVNMLDVSVILN